MYSNYSYAFIFSIPLHRNDVRWWYSSKPTTSWPLNQAVIWASEHHSFVCRQFKLYVQIKDEGIMIFNSELPCTGSFSPGNPPPPSAAYMCQKIGSILMQILPGFLLGARPLSKPMLDIPLGTSFSEISITIRTFSIRKMRLEVSSTKWQSFCPGEMS